MGAKRSLACEIVDLPAQPGSRYDCQDTILLNEVGKMTRYLLCLPVNIPIVLGLIYYVGMGKIYEIFCIHCSHVLTSRRRSPLLFLLLTISKSQPPLLTEMDIHMPAVASSPNPQNGELQSNGNAKEDLLALMGEKDIVEAKLKALGGVLDSVSSLSEMIFFYMKVSQTFLGQVRP